MFVLRCRAAQFRRLVFALLLLGLSAQVELGEPFGLSTAPVLEGPLWVTWRDLQSKMQSEQRVIARCRANPGTCSSAAALKFIAMVKEGDHHEGLSRIGRINRAVNFSIQKVNGIKPDAVPTKWTSPLDTLVGGIGDCKQYSVLKYAVLLDAGYARDDVRLIILKVVTMQRDHAVVAIRSLGRWYILDNNFLAVLESRKLRNHIPLFALDYRGVRQFVMPSAPRVAGLPCSRAIG